MATVTMVTKMLKYKSNSIVITGEQNFMKPHRNNLYNNWNWLVKCCCCCHGNKKRGVLKYFMKFHIKIPYDVNVSLKFSKIAIIAIETKRAVLKLFMGFRLEDFCNTVFYIFNYFAFQI